ncbi:pyridoxal-dependent decarboxylase [Ferruginibacter paludis]|uniref:pyridoxal phosphate-dependent decarboxylase family protein n=1 Tax=Ferruginibacter paludis TaxID=1310417 RepID=UPI0025B543C5|nr:pyridoxal-dependent decarboxylase [Ferruginibacter paludis]MDN3657124.1 pyridoxal-dependent decarboxylase [Ferruginibacter paludis]
MDNYLLNDSAQAAVLLEQIKVQSLAYLQNLSNRPTTADVQVETTDQLNSEGVGTANALQQFNDRFEKIMVASSGPRYWGFVTGGTTPAAIAGDWLATVYDQNTQTANGQGDISAIIEKETIQLLLNLLNLPADFLGGFVTGATMSNFTCLGVARQWVGKVLNKDFAKEGVSPADINIFSATPHSSSVKALSMLGIGSSSYTRVKTLESNREAIDMDDLQNKINELNGKPFILISSAGTVNTVDFDDFNTIVQLKNKYNFFWHIDAAFGGFAACSPKYKYLVDGWQYADSITIDCHKWLNVPYENGCWLIKEKHKLLQVETFQNSNAPYLGDPLEHFSYLNFLPENSRRLKALPVWFSLIAYGKNGYKDIVENCIGMAKQFGNFIQQQKALELLAPVRLNTVCFTLNGQEEQSRVQTLLENINASGRIFMTATVYKGRIAIRAAFVNWRTSISDIDIAIEVVEEELQKMYS